MGNDFGQTAIANVNPYATKKDKAAADASSSRIASWQTAATPEEKASIYDSLSPEERAKVDKLVADTNKAKEHEAQTQEAFRKGRDPSKAVSPDANPNYKDPLAPPVAPDAADELLMKGAAGDVMRLRRGSRRNSFLGGAGDVRAPLGNTTLLGRGF